MSEYVNLNGKVSKHTFFDSLGFWGELDKNLTFWGHLWSPKYLFYLRSANVCF